MAYTQYQELSTVLFEVITSSFFTFSFEVLQPGKVTITQLSELLASGGAYASFSSLKLGYVYA